MNYYQWHIGDYRRDTAHLSLLEHGVYRQLLDTYYLNEQPLCADEAILMRTHCARTAEEVQAVRNVLHDFFVKTEQGWVHGHCEAVIAAYQEKSEKARQSATARWEREKTKRNAPSMRSHSEGNANHKPITNNQEPKDQTPFVDGKPPPPPCPHLEIVDLYNRILPELQAVIPDRWDGARAKHLQARWRESPKHQSLDFWERFFTTLRKYSWYLGDNDRGWKANLEWIVAKRNFDNLIEKFVTDSRRSGAA